MKKYRALVSFAGSVLSMFAGEEKEIKEDVADEFVKIGYIILLSNENENNEENEENSDTANEDNETNETENDESDNEENKSKNTRRRGK